MKAYLTTPKAIVGRTEKWVPVLISVFKAVQNCKKKEERKKEKVPGVSSRFKMAKQHVHFQ